LQYIRIIYLTYGAIRRWGPNRGNRALCSREWRHTHGYRISGGKMYELYREHSFIRVGFI